MSEHDRRSVDGMFHLPLGRIAGVPVRVHWSVLFTALLVAEILAANVLPSEVRHRSAWAYWAAGATGALLFLASILAHELMHVVLARHYGVPVKRITLWLLGGMSEMTGEPPSPRAAAVIAGAGPATSLGVGVGFGLVGWVAMMFGASTLVGATLLWLAVTNGILAVFNMLPAAPLDGGRVLQAVLWRRYRNSYRATVAADRVGRALGIAMVGVGVLELLAVDVVGGIWLALIGMFLISASRSESTVAAIRKTLATATLGELMRPLPGPVPSWWTTAHLHEMRPAGEPADDLMPVVDFDGRGLGVVSWRDTNARGGSGEEATVGTICRRLPVLPAGSGVVEAIRGGAFARGAVLVQDGALFGLVSAADLENAARSKAA